MSFNQVSIVKAVEFYIAGSNDNKRQADGFTTNRSLFLDNMPVNGGLYDPHYGTTELEWKCSTCHNRKNLCPGHMGMMQLKYPLQNPHFRREIIRYLKIVCQRCGQPLSNRELKRNPKKENILSEYVQAVRGSNIKMMTCSKENCKFENPWITRDKENHPLVWQEYYTKDGKLIKRELIFNHQIKKILERIPIEFVRKMGKGNQHPSKLLVDVIQLISNSSRPEIQKIGGGRNNMSDFTSSYRQIFDFDQQIPTKIPDPVDKTLQKLLLSIDLTYYSLIAGNSANAASLKMTASNKVTRSMSEQLNKKTGLIRSHLMGKKVRNMARSVITGDKALHPSYVGIPQFIACNIWIPMVVASWNYNECLKLFENGKINKYPGAEKIWRKDMNAEYYVTNIGDSYKPQLGDRIFAHLRDGNPICFNRQPSLLYCSIVSFLAKILTDEKTIKFNSCLCNFFNADFDGDEMNLLIPTSLMARLEIILVSSINEWFINYQNSGPRMGMFQDSFIGCFEMSQHNQTMKKWYAMNMLTRTIINKPLILDKPEYKSLEILSFPIPKINYNKSTTFYNSDLSKFMNYHDNDKRLIIKDGQIIQGRLDGKSIGQNTIGSIFHTMYSEFGSSETIDTIYNLQQITNNYLYYKGYTISLGDLFPTIDAEKEITVQVEKMLDESNNLVTRLDNGELISPIGMTTMDYYEGLQQNILSPGDEFIKPIYSRLNLQTNSLAKMVLSGSKGKKVNIVSIFSAIGQTWVNGDRPKNSMQGRTSIYYDRFSMNPISKGYIKNSFAEGIQPESFLFAAMEARSDIIDIALSTAISGEMERNGVKNMENLLVSNFLGLQEDFRVIQLLYGDNGIDPRHMEECHIHGLMLSTKAYKEIYLATSKDFTKKYHNKTLNIMLQEEYNRIESDREWFKKIMIRFESSQESYLLSDIVKLPVNLDRIIADIINSHNTIDDKGKRVSLSKDLGDLNPTEAINMVDTFCNNLGYVHYHPNYQLKKRKIHPCVVKAIKITQMIIRERLCTKKLIKFNFTNKLLEIVLNRIKSKYLKSFVTPGLAAGVIAVQSVSEPITQYFLDSKHRSGAKTGGANFIDQIREILNFKLTEKMVSPEMKVYLKPEYEQDKAIILEIANHIEMMKLGQFIKNDIYQIFVESLPKGPSHPEYKLEDAINKTFLAHSYGSKIPNDLSPFVIRYELDKEKLILKSMKVITIINALNRLFPFLFIVHSPENSGKIILRLYISSGSYNPKQAVREQDVYKIADQVYNSIIRGVKDIKYAEIKEDTYTKCMEDGSMQPAKKFYIHTSGINLEAMMCNPYVDIDQLYINSLEETFKHYGIEASRHDIVDNLQSTLKYGASYSHISIYADIMTCNGSITSIERSGLGKRDTKSILKRVSFGSPKQVLQFAAINNIREKITGISPSLMMGTCPKFGTTYNKIMMDETFLAKKYRSVDKILDDL
jgi:DNA-directed RNA polymerase II subunit RPB1